MTTKEEEDYRALLNDELPERSYRIGSGKWVVYTGKAGYINFMVGLKKAVPSRPPEGEALFVKLKKGAKPFKTLTEPEIKKALEEVMEKPEFKNSFPF